MVVVVSEDDISEGKTQAFRVQINLLRSKASAKRRSCI